MGIDILLHRLDRLGGRKEHLPVTGCPDPAATVIGFEIENGTIARSLEAAYILRQVFL
jgi:hypothetical protein